MNDGIKTTKLDSVKSTISASFTYHQDFDGYITLYKDFIDQPGGALQFHIKAVGTGGTGDGGIRGGNVKVGDYYYKKEGVS